MENPVEIEGVWKSYGNTPAVRNLTLRVPQQSVYGFLGPNGAGKSTTIRMILGLQKPDRGRIALFGNPIGKAPARLLAGVGSLVESPSLYPNLTGRENLEVHRRLLNAPKSCIDDALSTVDLMGAAGRVARGYSSGMKQRLGIAQALLGNPGLLLLDEPTNGLDPAGIHEVRSLIRDLPSRRGVTIFLSSHLLAEVEQVATHFAILSAGQLRFEGTSESLRDLNKPAIALEVDDGQKARKLLAGFGMVVAGERGQVKIHECEWEPSRINALLVNAGVAVSRLNVSHTTLEDAFLELTRSEVEAPACR